MFTRIRLTIRDWFKKYKKIIIIVAVIWAIVIIINYSLKNMPKIEVPKTTYKPHTAVMDESEVPERLQSPIENLIKEFIDACNEKNYEKAYSLLSNDCKKDVFPEQDDLQLYIDRVFPVKKIYNIQNFSNKDDYYIYSVTILEDIMASGLTNVTELETYEETFVIKEDDDELKLSIRGYIGNKTVDQMYEDEYIKINIENVKIDYYTMTYYVKIRNKTNNIVVLYDGSQKNEIVLNTSNSTRNLTGLYIEPIIINPEVTKTFEMSFGRFYDESGTVKSLKFNSIRILKTYAGTEETRQEELENAVKNYNIEMEL